MADFLAGDVLVRLRADTAAFNQALQDVIARLAQLNQASTQATAQQSQSQQSTTQLAQAYATLTQAVAQHAQALAQANQASLQQVQASKASAQATTQHTAASQQLLQGVRQSQQAMTTLTQALTQQTTASQASTQALSALTQQLQTFQGAQRQGTQTTQAFGSALQTAFTIAGGIGIATSIGAIVSQMKDLAVSTIQVGAQFQQLRVSLNAVTGGQGAQAFQFLTDTANRYGFSLTNLAANYRSLAAATRGTMLEGEQTRRIFEAVTAASRTLGSSSEQVGRTLQALQQMVSKGVVSMEELRQQLSEGLPGAFQIAARAMGVTTERLNEMVSSGQVLSVDFLPKFARQLQQELGQGAVQAANTAQAAFARLENEWQALKDRIARSGPLTFVTRLAGFLAGDLEADRKRLEEEQARIERQAVQRQVIRGPGARPVPGSLETGTEQELVRLKAINVEIDALDKKLTEIRADPVLRFTGLQAGELQRFEAMRTSFVQEQERIQERINARRVGRAGAAARTSEDIDRTGEETERVKGLEAGNKKLNETLTAQQKLQQENAERYARAPELLGSTTNKAELEVARLNAGLKVQRDGLEELLKQEKALGTAVDPALRAKIDASRAAIQADEARKESIEATVAAEKKAAQEAIQATREAAAEKKRAVTEAIGLDATLERLQGMTRRPSENQAEEAATRVRTQYAGAVAEAEKLIVTLERSKSLQAERPEALAQLRAVRDALRETGEAQAKLASDEVLNRLIAPLEALAAKYGLVTAEVAGQSDAVRALATTYNLTTKEVLDLVQAEKLAAELKGTAKQAEAEKYLQTIKDTLEARAKIEAQVPVLEQEALASFGPGMAARRRADFQTTLEGQLEQLQAPRDERATARLRYQARRKGVELGPEQEALLQQIEAQQRWNELIGMTERIGDAAAQTLTQGLQSIVDGTQSVGKAFQVMAQSILKSIAEITLNEGFKSLIRLGLGLLTTALAPGASAGAGLGDTTAVAAGSGVGDIGIGTTLGSTFKFQHGGVVSKPTHALIGEGGQEEFVLNSRQMRAALTSAMQAAPSAGGQAAGGSTDVSVILVDNRGDAERKAAQQRGLGRTVIIQEVVRDLSQGSGSTIGRAMRAGGH